MFSWIKMKQIWDDRGKKKLVHPQSYTGDVARCPTIGGLCLQKHMNN